MCLAFALGFVFGVVCEYFYQTHAPELSKQPRVEREAEDVAETAWRDDVAT